MATLDEETIEKIASLVHSKIQESSHTDFQIPPEEHYNAHKNLAEMYKDWSSARKLFTRIFIGFVVVGAFVLATLGAAVEWVRTVSEWVRLK